MQEYDFDMDDYDFNMNYLVDDHEDDIDDYADDTFNVGKDISDWISLMKEIASKRPSDDQAQARFRAAVDFYRTVEDFPQPLGDANLERQYRHRPSVPTEIWQLIVEQVLEFCHAPRQSSLIALSRSCKTLRALAQPHLYFHPRELRTTAMQWRFRFTLAVEPDLANAVQSLQVVWHPYSLNSQLLIDIARACPNITKLHVRRDERNEDEDLVIKQDVYDMADLLDACPRLTKLRCSAHALTPGKGIHYEDSLVDSRLEKSLSQLETLALIGQDRWVFPTLLRRTSAKLTSLEFSCPLSPTQEPHFFTDLAVRSPFLKVLEVRAYLITSDDLMRAFSLINAAITHGKEPDGKDRVSELQKSPPTGNSRHTPSQGGNALGLGRPLGNMPQA
ncbi:hypothetical protein FZEAL_40 [Fusarium zealandicum]|uniref:Uncharacterized protein n=1 Tax=Fusarium zealandicum TaxID=1053134 RepID=A0A8H4XQT6_9HYPO|nr:hypothetical protein FZEAL_40 [Fusarium zealandicum]